MGAKYKITRLSMCGNEGTALPQDVIYCALVEIASGQEVISSTLADVLQKIRDRDYSVEGVTAGAEPAPPYLRKNGVRFHSFVRLDAYQ